jgi:hypothetical protein
VKRNPITAALALIFALSPLAARAADERGFSVAVLVDGVERPEYAANGAFYVEALRGRDYTLRLTNPLPYRVAIALAVDGLNTIDAKRTTARDAAKWVLGPYETVVIPGWQVNGSTARRFTFTTEKRSYGAWLGKTENLGVIEAVYFRERPRPRPRYQPYSEYERDGDPIEPQTGAYDAPAREEGSALGAPMQAPEKRAAAQAPSAPKNERRKLSDEYAATGMGSSTGHSVESVSIDLMPEPIAQLRVRYEYRPELVKLGVLPRERERDPIRRRERSTGFASYCPEPTRGW